MTDNFLFRGTTQVRLSLCFVESGVAMTARDISEIGITALVAALAVTGIFMARPGASVDPQPQLTSFGVWAPVGACNVTAAMKSPILNGTIDSVLTVHNSTSVSQTTTFSVEVVRRIFKGSLASRVVSPSDYKSTTIKTQSMNVSLAANSTRDIPLIYVLPAIDPKDTTSGAQITYMIGIDYGDHDAIMAGAVAPPPAVAGHIGGLVASASTR